MFDNRGGGNGRTVARRPPAELAVALAMRLGSELRAGAAPVIGGLPPRRAVLPVTDALAPLLPEGGLSGQIGIDVTRRGATSLLFGLLAVATAKGLWCAVVDQPRLYPLAATAARVDLDQLALIDVTGIDQRLAALGALCEGIPIVTTSTKGLTTRQVARAGSKASRTGTVIIWLEHQPTPRLDARIAVTSCKWLGLRPNQQRRWGSGPSPRAVCTSPPPGAAATAPQPRCGPTVEARQPAPRRSLGAAECRIGRAGGRGSCRPQAVPSLLAH